ncbi:delta-60 repeat domain-containing protein [Flavobacterium sp. ALD4]|uniref:delta-60 repeat domain-containing protein n=1 Tax=Flavobacterium sp. ALD4 TaxID=2058314 RepID=UPI001E54D1B8|nr:delta-60 repeat domain-containing protein [Flavobacterium sp. ALD4]
MNSKLRCYLLLICFLFLGSIMAQQGVLDVTFNTVDDGLQGDGFDNIVRTVALQADGDLIVEGDYLYFNGISLPYLSRLKPDGTVDASFNLGSGFNGKVYSTLIQPDGKIIVGGSFTSYNGIAVGRLIRLNSNGSSDTSFSTGLGVTNNIVYATAQQSDGKTIVVGSFTKYNTTNANRVVRILPDGSLDSTFAIGSGASGLVGEVKVQTAG